MINDPKKKATDEACEGIDCAEETLHKSVSQVNPEWVSEDGECQSCVSMEHEMAANPDAIPEELDQ